MNVCYNIIFRFILGAIIFLTKVIYSVPSRV